MTESLSSWCAGASASAWCCCLVLLLLPLLLLLLLLLLMLLLLFFLCCSGMAYTDTDTDTDRPTHRSVCIRQTQINISGPRTRTHVPSSSELVRHFYCRAACIAIVPACLSPSCFPSLLHSLCWWLCFRFLLMFLLSQDSPPVSGYLLQLQLPLLLLPLPGLPRFYPLTFSRTLGLFVYLRT